MVDFNFNLNSMFYGIIRDGKIFNSNNQEIGVTTETYHQAIKTAREYQDILYEKGLLQKPKTVEEINKEMSDTMLKMSNTITELSAKIDKLEKANDKQR